MQTFDIQKLTAFITRQDQPIAVVCDLGLSGLAATLGLGRMGVPVLGICHRLKFEGAYSRYCFKVLSPDPDKQPEDYINFLVEIGQLLKTKAVLIPTSDVAVDLLSRMKERLAPCYLFPISDYQTVKILSDKGEFKKELERLGLPHPRTFVPNGPMGIEQIASEVKYPCIIKPVHSLTIHRPIPCQGVCGFR